MSLYIWTLVPLLVLHIWLGRRHPEIFKFQVLLDLVLLAVLGHALLTGNDLNPVRYIENDPPFENVEWSSRTAYQPTQSDVVLYFHPWWEAAGRQIRRGKLPLIAPEFGAGLPLFANGQIAVWAPMMAPVWLHGPERGTTIMAFWKIEIAGLGAFLLMLRGWRLRWTAAAVGGIAWAGSPHLVSWLLVSLAWVSALLPWVWWAAWWMMRRRTPRWSLFAVGIGLGWLTACGLHPETAFIVCASALVAALLFHPRRWYRSVVAGFIAGTVALVLAWPTLGYIRASSRVTINTADPSDNESFDWAARRDVIRQIAVPASMGHPGRGDWRPAYPHAPGAAGVGGAVFALLAAGAISRRYRRIAWVAGMAATVGAVLLVRIPPLDQLLMSIPPIGHMTVPRFGILLPWGLVILAALSLDGAMRGRTRGPLTRLIPAAVVAVCALWAAPWNLRPVDTWLVVLSVTAAVSVGLLRRWSFVPVIVAGELALLAAGINPLADPRDRLPEPALVQRLAEHQSASPSRIIGIKRTLQSNLAARYGLRDLRAADPLRPAPFAKLLRSLGEPPVIVGGSIKRAPAGLCGAWGVGAAVTPPGERLTGWDLLYSDDDGAIWSNPKLLAEVRLVGRVVVEPDDLESLKALTSTLDFTSQALVGPGDVDVESRRMTLEIVERTPQSLETTVDCDGVCLLVVAQPWAPGWAAAVDGRAVPIVRTNIAGLGVVVPPGRHEVDLNYHPWRWWGEVP